MAFNPEQLDRKKEEVVQIIDGVENAVSAMWYCTSSAKETIDLYAEGTGVYTAFHYPENLKLHKEALDRGVRTRLITEITKDNLPHIKRALPYLSDVRHMDTITHYFGVSERHYLSNKLQYLDPALTQSIFSNVGWFVKEQQYLFETLWKKAIPLKQRIREIEEGHNRQFIDAIRDPTEVLGLLPNLVSSAYEEIVLLFPTPKILRSFESSGLTELIYNHIQKNSNAKVKLLLQRERGRGSREDEDSSNDYYYHHQEPQQYYSSIKDISNNNKLIKHKNVKVKFANPDQIDTKTALVIIDGDRMMTIELDEQKDNDHYSLSEPNLSESIKFATYTNNESTIMSYASIFERIWIESEIKQQH